MLPMPRVLRAAPREQIVDSHLPPVADRAEVASRAFSSLGATKRRSRMPPDRGAGGTPMIHATTRRSVLGFIFISAMVLVLAGPVPRADAAQVRCCQGSVCAMRSAKKCAAQGGVNIGPGKCAANSCAGATTTTTTTVPTTTTTVTTTTTTVPTTTTTVTTTTTTSTTSSTTTTTTTTTPTTTLPLPTTPTVPTSTR